MITSTGSNLYEEVPSSCPYLSICPIEPDDCSINSPSCSVSFKKNQFSILFLSPPSQFTISTVCLSCLYRILPVPWTQFSKYFPLFSGWLFHSIDFALIPELFPISLCSISPKSAIKPQPYIDCLYTTRTAH